MAPVTEVGFLHFMGFFECFESILSNSGYDVFAGVYYNLDLNTQKYSISPGKPEYGHHPKIHLQQIHGHDGEYVEREALRLEIVSGQLAALTHHQPLLQVSRAELEGDVQSEHQVREPVQAEPHGGPPFLQFRERLKSNVASEMVMMSDETNALLF